MLLSLLPLLRETLRASFSHLLHPAAVTTLVPIRGEDWPLVENGFHMHCKPVLYILIDVIPPDRELAKL